MFYDWSECVMSVLGTTKIPRAIVLTLGNTTTTTTTNIIVMEICKVPNLRLNKVVLYFPFLQSLLTRKNIIKPAPLPHLTVAFTTRNILCIAKYILPLKPCFNKIGQTLPS